MRIATILLTLIFACALMPSKGNSVMAADEGGTQEDVVPWLPGFAPISESRSDDAFVLMVISNDRPWTTQPNRSGTRGQVAGANVEDELPDRHPAMTLWCQNAVDAACREVMERRPDLQSRLILQSLAAGLPPEIANGQNPSVPSRAVVAICDRQYRLLTFLIGVPDADDLQTLIEDAEELRATVRIGSESIGDSLAHRSRQRMGRTWRRSFDELVAAYRDEPDTEGETPLLGGNRDGNGFEDRIATVSQTFESIYMADVQLRFGLRDQVDQRRLVILEQHPQTRRVWCEAMLPFVVMMDFTASWRLLVESVWGHATVVDQYDVTELIAWVETLDPSEVIVFQHLPPKHLQTHPWPPVGDVSRQNLSWTQVHQQAQQFPFRTITAQELAKLIQLKDLQPVSLYHPTMARYLVLAMNGNRLQVVRESDAPGRLANVLKRSRASLVRQDSL